MNPVFSLRGAAKGGGLPGCSPPQPTKQKFKKTGFVDIVISNLFRYFPFSRNQPLKSADD
jgi:hypothetical protein